MLRALGALTAFRSSVFVPRMLVIHEALRLSGIDLANLERDPRARSSNGDGGGIYTNFSKAYFYAVRDCKPSLTITPPLRGMWGITDAGVQYARERTPVPVKSPRFFVEPLLKALGKLSQHSPTPVPREDLLRATLVEAGYDPDKLPLGWEEPTSNAQPKYQETIRWAARSVSAFVQFPSRGFWVLTPAGLERAARLNGATIIGTTQTAPSKPRTPNATSKWLSKHLAPARGSSESPLMQMMRGALRKHLPLSAQCDLIDDHIQTFMERVIRRDSFAKALETPEGLPYSKVATYCVHSGCSDVRGMGVEPVCRELLGARTERERSKALPEDASVGGPSVPLDSDGNFVLPEELDSEPGDCLDFETLWKQVEEVVQKAQPENWKQYSNILLLKARGFTNKEIAEVEHLSPSKANKMLFTVRQLVRGSDLGRYAV